MTCMQRTPEGLAVPFPPALLGSSPSVLQHHLRLGLQPVIASPMTGVAADFTRGLPGLLSAELLWACTAA